VAVRESNGDVDGDADQQHPEQCAERHPEPRPSTHVVVQEGTSLRRSKDDAFAGGEARHQHHHVVVNDEDRLAIHESDHVQTV
jgi:hypothetical protein